MFRVRVKSITENLPKNRATDIRKLFQKFTTDPADTFATSLTNLHYSITNGVKSIIPPLKRRSWKNESSKNLKTNFSAKQIDHRSIRNPWMTMCKSEKTRCSGWTRPRGNRAATGYTTIKPKVAWRGPVAPPFALFPPYLPLSTRFTFVRLCSRQGCIPCDHAQSHVVYMQSKCKVGRACLCRVYARWRACIRLRGAPLVARKHHDHAIRYQRGVCM